MSSIAESEKLWIAVDLGGTHCRLAAYFGTGRIMEMPEQLGEPLEFLVTRGDNANFDIDFKRLKAAIWQLSRLYGLPDKIVLAVAGEIDDERRMLISAGNLLHWVGVPIIDLMEEEFPHVSAYLGNDTEAATLAEAAHGHGRGKKFRLVGWGTGLGSCEISQCMCGELVTRPGEFGHQRVTDDPRRCGCGKRGCAEAQSGGASLQEIHGSPLSDLPRTAWLTAAEHVVTAVYNAVVTDRVQLVVFSGGVICKQDWLIPVMQKMLDGAMCGKNVPRLCISHFGESAGLIGAYVLGALLDKRRGYVHPE